MQNANSVVVNAGTVTGTTPVVSSKLTASQWVACSFMGTFSDAGIAGTMKIQFSNDVPAGVPTVDFTPTTWVDVPGSVATVAITSGAANVVYVPVNFVARWYRINFTPSAGSGTTTIQCNALFP